MSRVFPGDDVVVSHERVFMGLIALLLAFQISILSLAGMTSADQRPLPSISISVTADQRTHPPSSVAGCGCSNDGCVHPGLTSRAERLRVREREGEEDRRLIAQAFSNHKHWVRECVQSTS